MPRSGQTAAAPLLLLLLLCVAATAPLLEAAKHPKQAPKNGVPLSSSVMIFSNSDLGPTPKSSRCYKLLRAAATHGSKSVNIVLTQYWIDNRFKGMSQACNPDNWATGSKVDSYCQYGLGGGNPNSCNPFTAQVVAEVTAGLTACLTTAFDLFDEVLISPHLDDGTRTGKW